MTATSQNTETEFNPDAVKAKIVKALSKGVPEKFSYNDFKSIKDTGPVIPVTIKFDRSNTKEKNLLKSPLALSSLVNGNNLIDDLPINSPFLANIFNNIFLCSVSFVLYPDTKQLGRIACSIELGPEGKGLSWHPFGETGLAVTLQRLDFSAVRPGTKSQRFTATVVGELSIEVEETDNTEKKTYSLDVSLTLPETVLSVSQPNGQYFPVKALFKKLGMDYVPQGPLDFYVADFVLQGNVSTRSASIHTRLVDGTGPAAKNAGYPLITVDDIHVLVLDEITLNFAYEPTPNGITAGFAASMGFETSLSKGKQLMFTIGAEYKSGDIYLSGMLDVGGTLANWAGANDSPVPPEGRITLGEFAKNMFGMDHMPDAITNLYIKALSASYTKTGTGSGQGYTFYGLIGGDWKIEGIELETQISINISKEAIEGAAAKANIECDFDFDGFVLQLGYDFSFENPGKGEGRLALPSLGINGTYDFDNQVATVMFSEDLKLVVLVEWFITSYTGNPGFSFPEPWHALLGEFEIPKGLIITVDIEQQSISCQYTLSTSNQIPQFFGNKITGIEVSYTRNPKPNQPKLSFALLGSFPSVIPQSPSQDTSRLAWDPSQPGTEPTLPGADVLNLQMVALGQRVAFPTPAPDTVEAAINKLIEAFAPDKSHTQSLIQASDKTPAPLFPNKLNFNSDSAWLLGAKFTILGQVTIELIFNDPQIYGAMIRVDKAKSGLGNPTLMIFEGLYFEILYRKVTDTIGEYHAVVILPKQLSQIELGTIVLHLPSFSISIFTNGNFKIDIGFPHKADFSHSFGVTYYVFTGLGGFYFGSLNGATAKNLPSYDKANWDANPVIELGIGIAVGIQRGFTAGPMSAELTLMLQAILQGTYIQFNRQSESSSSRTVDYYRGSGEVRLVGQLTGAVDLEVITASFNVEIIFSALLTIEKYKKSDVALSAEVKISLRVKIGVGIFSFHIKVSFHHRISTSFAFGNNCPPPYKSAAQLEAFIAELIMAPPAMGIGANLQWVPITAGENTHQNLSAYLVPQLTYGDDLTDPGKQSPYYVAMIYLTHPIPTKNPALLSLTSDDTDSFKDFAEGVFLWTMNAYIGKGQVRSAADIKADTTSLNQVDIERLLELLTGTSAQFSAHQLHYFTETYFSLDVTVPDGHIQYGFCGFPMPSQLKAKYSPSNGPEMLVRSTLQMDRSYREQLPSRKAKRRLVLVDIDGKRRNLIGDDNSVDVLDKQLEEYIQIIVRNLIGIVYDGVKQEQQQSDVITVTVQDMLDTFDKPGASGLTAWENTAGFVSNFLLHGMRMTPEQSNESEPQFSLTGQQTMISGDAPDASLTLTKPANNDYWNTSFTGSAGTDPNQLEIKSSGVGGLLMSPLELQSVTFDFKPDLANPPPGEQTIISTKPQNFVFVNGAPWPAKTSSLWHFPPNFSRAIAEHSDATFVVYQGQHDGGAGASVISDPTVIQRVGTDGKVNYQWGLLVDFQIRRIAAGKGKYQDYAYTLKTVDQMGLARLVTLLHEISEPSSDTAPTISSLSIGYRSKDSLQFVSSATADFRLVQTNLSTESRPANVSHNLMRLARQATLGNAASGSDAVAFLARFWAGGVTNSGGYYLSYNDAGEGLPDYLFTNNDKQGGAQAEQAHISLMIELNVDQPASFTNVIAVSDKLSSSTESATVYFAEAESITNSHATIDAGHVAVEVTRNPPPQPQVGAVDSTGSGYDYSDSLDNLYTLLTWYVESIDNKPAVHIPTVTSGTGPVDPYGLDTLVTDDTAPPQLVYRETFPLLTNAGSGVLPVTNQPNPYATIGQKIGIFTAWTDLFGNFLSSNSPTIAPIESSYFDPVPNLQGLPNLKTSYGFYPTNGKPELHIKFAFDDSIYYDYQYQLKHTSTGIYFAVNDLDIVDSEKWKAFQSLTDRSDYLLSLLEEDQTLSDTDIDVLTKAQQAISDIDKKLFNDSRKYALFYYQLDVSGSDKAVVVTLSSSLLKKPSLQVPTDTLINDVVDVFAKLQAISANLGVYNNVAWSSSNLDDITVSTGFEPENINLEYVYVLNLALVFTRLGSIHPEFSDVPEVKSTTSTITPIPDQWKELIQGNDKKVTYLNFARNFAIAFSQSSMQIASGPVWDVGLTTSAKALWVVRFGAHGINPTFPNTATNNAIYCYSPVPLSTQLVSEPEFTIAVYNPNTGDLCDSRTLAVSDVDMDGDLKAALSNIETFLAPKLSVPGAVVNAAAVQGILATKELLAERLSNYVQGLTGDSSAATAALQAAIAKLKQECLTSLDSYYKVNALVSTELLVSFNSPVHDNFEPLIPQLNLFGTPILSYATGEKGFTQLSSSSGKALMSKAGAQIAFAIKSQDPALHSEYTLDFTFQLSAIEHDMRTVKSGGQDYSAGPWLRFINSSDPTTVTNEPNHEPVVINIPMGSGTIKIPLRVYPTPPTLLEQNYESTLDADHPLSMPTSPGQFYQLVSNDDALDQAKEWNFSLRYSHEYAAQDHVYLNFRINHPNSVKNANVLREGKRPLIQALTEFKINFPAILKELEKLASGDSSDITVKTLCALETLVASLYDADWDNLSSPPRFLAQLPILESNYQIIEGVDSNGKPGSSGPDDTYYVRVNNLSYGETNAIAGIPELTIPDLQCSKIGGDGETYNVYEILKDNKPITVGQARRQNQRVATLTGMNIIDHQSGISAIRVGRNEGMPEHFRYETPYVEFPDKVLPHLFVETKINFSDLNKSGKQDFVDYLQPLIAELLSDSQGSPTDQSGGVKLVCYYDYPSQLNPGANSNGQDSSQQLPDISLPIQLTLPISTPLDPTQAPLEQLINTTACRMSQWILANIPDTFSDNAPDTYYYRLDVTIFSDYSVSGQPLLQLQNLCLPIKAVHPKAKDNINSN